jgi:hypothetical protein
MELLANLFPSGHDENDLLWKYTEKPDTFARFTQFNFVKPVEKEEVCNEEETPVECTKVKVNRSSKRQLPLEIIIQLSENDPINTDYIKSKLIEFISKRDFQKVFGVKKTAEVMKGITENKWNKSLVLFLSFMYDTIFVYLNKEVTYDVAYKNKYVI